MHPNYPSPSGSQFSSGQQNTFLKAFGVDVIKDSKPVRVIFEQEKVEQDNVVSTCIYVTARDDDFVEDDVFEYKNTFYKVSYKIDDFSGLSNFYITLVSDTNRNSKYE